jgi:Calcineurin-like phosphoesterase
MANNGVPPGPREAAASLIPLKASPTVGRSAFVNHFHSAMKTSAPVSDFPSLAAFFSNNLWPWIRNYLKYVFHRRYPFPDYRRSGKSGVYPISAAPGDKVTVAIAGDWGTGTQEAQTIANLMCNLKPESEWPDLTIHLGDVYYVGDYQEIEENCFGQPANGYQGVRWPHGRRGSFALNGNHEMYANGKPYFTTFLSSLGMKGEHGGQTASFFSLETDHWRILAIDTGYNSVGIPILSQIPWINTIPFIGGDCHLEQTLLSWLRDTVKPHENPKATLLLSHHEYFTAFSDYDYVKPAKQLMEFFEGQEIVWIWGHEHRLAIYDTFSKKGGITVFGRCVGHSGMPVEVSPPNLKKAPLRYYDARTHQLEGTPVGQNGFANVTLDQATLTLEYRDIDNNQLLIETFTPGAGGTLVYTVTDPTHLLTKV